MIARLNAPDYAARYARFCQEAGLSYRTPSLADWEAFWRRADSIFRDLMDAWIDSGRDFARISDATHQVAKLLAETALNGPAWPSGPAMRAVWRQRADSKMPPEDYAAVLDFYRLTTNLLARDVGRCDRCRAFFLNTSGHRRKRFCAPRCGRLLTAKVATRARRDREKAERLARVSKAIRTLRGRPGWKVRAAVRARVTRNFISRNFLPDGSPKPPKGDPHAQDPR